MQISLCGGFILHMFDELQDLCILRLCCSIVVNFRHLKFDSMVMVTIHVGDRRKGAYFKDLNQTVQKVVLFMYLLFRVTCDCSALLLWVIECLYSNKLISF